MARKPMKENEKRPLRMFMPELNKVCDVTPPGPDGRAGLAGGRQEASLLRVDQTTCRRQATAGVRFRVYVDAKGQVLKSEQDVMGGIVNYRTTKEGRRHPAGPSSST